MPLPRFAKLDTTQQQRLLEAATREFAEHGYEGASFNRIIIAAGVSKGAMYYYFADKADLYRTVVQRAVDAFAEAAGELDPFQDANGFWLSVAGLLERAATFLTQEPEHAALGRAVYGQAGGVLDELVVSASRWVGALLVKGQRVGAVRQDVPHGLLTEAVTGLVVAMDRWLAAHWDELGPEEVARLAPKTLELCQDLLSPRATNR
jgi:AcrR family transcriptional regulator